MSIHTSLSEARDPDTLRRPVVAFGVTLLEHGMAVPRHQHRKAQLLYVAKGTLTCEDRQGLWIVPPRCALWIPGGAAHEVTGSKGLEFYLLFVEPRAAAALPMACGTVSVSPFLRELLVRCAKLPALYPRRGAAARLTAVLLDELAAVSLENLHLPMPEDPRLRRLLQQMMATPSDRATMPVWARRVGVSERTLNRLLCRETGLSFGRWRQQLHLVLAVRWLAADAQVQTVASDLGYENASSFVTMFRKALGSSPARYMSARLRADTFAANGSGGVEG